MLDTAAQEGMQPPSCSIADLAGMHRFVLPPLSAAAHRQQPGQRTCLPLHTGAASLPVQWVAVWAAVYAGHALHAAPSCSCCGRAPSICQSSAKALPCCASAPPVPQNLLCPLLCPPPLPPAAVHHLQDAGQPGCVGLRQALPHCAGGVPHCARHRGAARLPGTALAGCRAATPAPGLLRLQPIGPACLAFCPQRCKYCLLLA